MENVDVSFVIPAYNCSKVVGRAIESIMNQKLSAFEIVIVNDCSNDDTLEVLDEFARQFSFLRVISHEVNKNLGAARNTGIDASRGEFVYFVDADDWLEPGGVAGLLEVARARGLDVVACGVQTVSEDGEVKPYHAWDFESSGGIEGVDYFSQYKIGAIAWNKLYRKSFLDRHEIRFVEGYFHEDIIFTARIALECMRYVSISKVVMNYFQSKTSICNSVPTRRHLASYLNLYISMAEYFGELNRRGIGDPGLVQRLSRSYGFAEVLPKLQRYAATRPRSVFVRDVFDVVDERLGPAGTGIADFVCGSFENYAQEG
ncbi:glycosyltransferase family 2 protein [Aromatoleum evansii]|uniref:glycosyltransferase family 2 protein n=1 Tax=Aromatoleum evansii TaxID=59406 RepID=UPI00145FA259|nr:glycosyltransferase [Aromatoleum evansii]NMG29129.1 glycosyltransferase [Aromatoleum evansii]